MRIIPDNATEIGRATITASSSASGFGAENMQYNDLEAPWRSNATMAATISIALGEVEAIDSVALGWCNFSPDATVTVRRWLHDTGSTTYDEVVVTADVLRPMTDFVPASSGLSVGSAFAQQVPLSVEIWFSAWAWTDRIEIIINDPGTTNQSGYLEAARVVAGLRHDLTAGPSYGIGLQVVDKTETLRAESGALRSLPGAWFRRLSLDLSWMTAIDVVALLRIVKGRCVYLSIFPGSTSLQQRHAMFCAVVDDPLSKYALPGHWAQSITFEEIA